MSTNIKKYEVEGEVRVALFKNWGNITAASQELGFSLEYVSKIAAKMKRKMKRDVSYHLAISISEMLWSGFHYNKVFLEDYLSYLRGRKNAELSICCKAPFEEKQQGNESSLICLKCFKTCHTRVFDSIEIHRLICDTIRLMSEERKDLLDFAVKMGFTAKEEVPTPVVKQNLFVFGDRKISEDERILIKDIDNLSPMEREKARKRIEGAILSGNFDEKEGK